MANPVVTDRLQHILDNLKNTYTGTNNNQSATKGAARATFVKTCLDKIIPSGLRISQGGEIIDTNGKQTGELDIIIENGYLPSLPISNGRVFFCEGVAAVIEVKSNLSNQWNEVIKTGTKLNALERKISGAISMNASGGTIIIVPGADFSRSGLGKRSFTGKSMLIKKIPYFVVGYNGWANHETLRQKVFESNGVVSGILQIDIEHFVSNEIFNFNEGGKAMSLLHFINAIHESASCISNLTSDLLDYGR